MHVHMNVKFQKINYMFLVVITAILLWCWLGLLYKALETEGSVSLSRICRLLHDLTARNRSTTIYFPFYIFAYDTNFLRL